MLDTRIARKLHLRGVPERVAVPTKTLATKRVIAPDVELGPGAARELSMIVEDLSFTEDSLGIRVGALIGFDLLGQSPFTINDESKRLVFGPIDPSFVTAPYLPGLPYPIVDLRIEQERLRILVDTGTSNLVWFESALRNCRAAVSVMGRETWLTMGGEMPVHKAELSEAFLGSASWRQRVVYIPETSENQSSGLAGLLGAVALGKRVAFDPGRKLVAWELNAP